MTGRPSDYSDEVVGVICSRLAAGEPLVKMCRDEGMPHVATVYRWLAAHEGFRDMYARAREDQADTLADQIIDIADQDPATIITAGDEENAPELRVDGAAIQHQRLRVDARKWIAAKLKPRKYGDFGRQEITGAEGGPVAIAVAVPQYDDIRAAIKAQKSPA